MHDINYCKRNVIRYSKLLYDRGLVTAAGGNVSMRCGDRVVVTASGVSLRDSDWDNLIVCTTDGTLVECPEGLKPSKETRIHLGVYRAKPEIDSVIHVHPAYSVAYSIHDRLIPIVTASAKMKLVEVPIADYGNPGTTELADAVIRAVEDAPQHVRAVVMKAHGIVAYEKGMPQCFDIAELVEDTARIAYLSDTLSK